MSPTTIINFADRFGRAYQTGARIVYPTRRGSTMELIEATVIDTGYEGAFDAHPVIYAKRNSGVKVTLKNLWDVVVVPA